MITSKEFQHYLNQLLEPERFNDYCPNGLQVQGNENISVLVSGVTASQNLIDAAIELNADTILVHHGYFWKNENPIIVGIKHNRLSALLTNNINLFAYHLPLDAHLVYGNNVKLAEVLGFKVNSQLEQEPLVFLGELAQPIKEQAQGQKLAKHISQGLGRKPLYISANQRPIHSIAWCTGAAQGFIEHAVEAGVDAYITGEASEQTIHIARENNLHFYAAGHHATERYGVKALGEHVAKQFSLTHHFIDIDNPV